MEEIQTYWQIPSIAHFCNLFRNQLDLPDFDYEDLEFAFLSDIKPEPELGLIQVQNNLVLRLIYSLLKGYFGIKITNDNWEQYLTKIIQIQWISNEKKRSPFCVIDETGVENSLHFDELPLRKKVEIVQCLCDYRLFSDDVSEAITDINADDYRVEPLGKDSKGYVYWYFYGTRLYRENPTVALNIETNIKKSEESYHRRAEQEQKRKALFEAKLKKEEEKKVPQKTPKRSLPPKIVGSRTGLRERKSDIIANGICVNNGVDSPHSSINSLKTPKRTEPEVFSNKPYIVSSRECSDAWTIICRSEQEWVELAQSFKNSKTECEIDFYRLLTDSFVPKICDIFANEEREKSKFERQKLIELLPRRLSSRIELKKMQKEKEELVEEEKQKKEMKEQTMESVKQRSERIRMERESRAQKRLQLVEERAERAKKRFQDEINGINNDNIDSEAMDESNGSNPPQLQFNIEENFIDKPIISPTDNIETFYEALGKVLNAVKQNRDAWPFTEAVDRNAFPMYYQVIEEPIDLSIIQQRINDRYYEDFTEVENDFKLMINNCETFNGPKNGYTLMAYGVWRAFKKACLKYLEKELTNNESTAFIYPQKPNNTNIKPAIEAKKKKSQNKRRSTFKALNVLAEAAEKAVEANDRVNRVNVSNGSSLTASSPRSSYSYDEHTNDGSIQENVNKVNPPEVHGDILARFLFNANNSNQTLNTNSLPISTQTHENLTFKSLNEWSESIKQSGNSVVLPQHAVIISSPKFKNFTNGPTIGSDQNKFVSLKVVSTGVNTHTDNVTTNSSSFTSAVISNNENQQKDLVNIDPKRLVIKLSRCQSGQVWKPVKLIKTNSQTENHNIITGINNFTTSTNENSAHTNPTVQQFQQLRTRPNHCVPVKKRILFQNFNDKQSTEKLFNFNNNEQQSNGVNNNSSVSSQMISKPIDTNASSPSFQITGLQQNNNNLRVFKLQKLDQSTVSQNNNNTQQSNQLLNQSSNTNIPKVLLLPLAKQPNNGEGLSYGS